MDDLNREIAEILKQRLESGERKALKVFSARIDGGLCNVFKMLVNLKGMSMQEATAQMVRRWCMDNIYEFFKSSDDAK